MQDKLTMPFLSTLTVSKIPDYTLEKLWLSCKETSIRVTLMFKLAGKKYFPFSLSKVADTRSYGLGMRLIRTSNLKTLREKTLDTINYRRKRGNRR